MFVLSGGMSGGHFTAYANCEDITVESDPCLGLHSLSEDVSWTDSHVFLRELFTQVGVCDEPVDDHVAGYSQPLSSTSTTNNNSNTPQAPRRRWYKFDDEFVHDMNYSSPSSTLSSTTSSTSAATANSLRTNATSAVEQAIVSESAYLLFYRKRQLSKENLMRYL